MKLRIACAIGSVLLAGAMVLLPSCGVRTLCANMCECAECDGDEFDECGVTADAFLTATSDLGCAAEVDAEATCDEAKSECDGSGGLDCEDAATLACIELCRSYYECVTYEDVIDPSFIADCVPFCLAGGDGSGGGGGTGECGDGTCDSDEYCDSCESDCGICSDEVCGDGSCSASEDCSTCESDCGACGDEVCGDGYCSESEYCDTCEVDCGVCSDVGAICDSGLTYTDDPTVAECLSLNCCEVFRQCSSYGQDPEACAACFNAGAGPLCDAAIQCALDYCPIP